MTAMRLRVLWVGRTKHAATQNWASEYLLRLRRFTRIEAEELPDKAPEAALLRRAANGRLILLDPSGKALSSTQMARWLEQAFARDSRELIFAIGGADGWSEAIRRQADQLLSLSAMTFSHELARVMLLEQLYRACTILANHPYPR